MGDYHLHLIVPNEITNFDRFRTSLREVLEIIKASDDREKMKRVIEENARFKRIESEAVSAINVFTGMKIPVNQKEGEIGICKAWEEQRLYDRAEGTIELLEDIGEPSSAHRKLIMEQSDIEVLRRWLKFAVEGRIDRRF